MHVAPARRPSGKSSMVQAKQRFEASLRKQKVSERRWVVAAACAFCIYAVTLVLETTPKLSAAPEQHTFADRPKCSKVFIDLGSNVGDSIVLFASPGTVAEKRRGPLTALGVRYASTLSEFCIYGFEGNPRFTSKLQIIEQSLHPVVRYAEMFTETVVSDRDGNATLYLDDVSGNHEYWGSSLLPTHKSVRKSSGQRVLVRAVDFTRFLTAILPSTPAARNAGADGSRLPKYGDQVVIVKMDVEGTEYDLLRDMAVRGVLCNRVDYLLVEWHDRVFEGAPGASRMTETMRERQRAIEWLLQSEKCRTKLITQGVAGEHAPVIKGPLPERLTRKEKEGSARKDRRERKGDLRQLN